MTVLVVTTGGTIASTPDAGGDAAPSLTGEDLIGAVPPLADLCTIETCEFANVPSPHLTVADTVELAARLGEYDADPDIEAVVITQGTDVLEETAYGLELCYDGETPVVVTGAMRNPSLPSPDGPANLHTAVKTALANEASTHGVLVAFNDRIHPARDVVKTHSSVLDTFRSPEFGPLAVHDEAGLTWCRHSTGAEFRVNTTPGELPDDVLAVPATLDMSPRQIEAAQDADALCLATMGVGHIPPSIIPALESLTESGVPIVVTTRCGGGRLATNTYGFEGSETTLVDLGVYYSDLPLTKTRIRAILALAENRLPDAFTTPQPA